jgi:Rieske Fe-S protein
MLMPLGIKLAGCGNNVQVAPVTQANLLSNGLVRLNVSQYPDLQPIGGALTLRFDGLALDTPYQDALRGLLLIHRGEVGSADLNNNPPFICTQSACPHAGCPLGYSAADQLIECPCHSSRFRSTQITGDPLACIGRMVHLPATNDLTVYSTSFDSTTEFVTIDLNKVIGCGAAASLPAPVAGVVTLSFTDYPGLQDPGGQVVGRPDGFADSLIVFRIDATTVAALSSVCTHLGCDVAYDPVRGDMECPCHGSLFSTAGALVGGPALRGLKSYPATLTATGVDVSVA